MFNIVLISGESRGLKEGSYFNKVIKILNKELSPMLIIAPCKGKRGFTKVTDGLWYYCFPSLFHYFVFSLSRHQLKTKIIVSQDPFIYGLMALMLSHKQRVIAEIHSHFFFNRKWWAYRFRNKLYHVLGRKIIEKANKIRVVYDDRILKKRYPEKFMYVPSNYTDTKQFYPDKKVRKELDVLFVGRLHPQKNIDYLVELMRELKRKGYNVKIIGKGNKKYMLKIKQYRIDYEEYVDDLSKTYKKSKVLVIVSHDEGGPRVAYEALASGCLIATTPTGKIKDDIRKYKECGEFLTANNLNKDIEKVIKLIKEYNLRWTKCYTQIIKELDFDKEVLNYAKNYKHLLNK